MLRPYLEKKRTRLMTPISVEAQVGSLGSIRQVGIPPHMLSLL